jgi:hypothetical protein
MRGRRTAAELLSFAVRARSQATAALTKLDTVDVESLPPALRAQFESVRAGWLKLLAMTADDVIDLYLELCGVLGRELRPDDLPGLLLKQ